MTELTRTDRRSNRLIGQAAIAGLVLAAALIAGVVGGLVGARMAGGAAAHAVQAAPRTASVDWVQYGRSWESQYRAMYPTTTNLAALKGENDWQRRYQQQSRKDAAKWIGYGTEWQRQYEQQHPAR